MRTITSHRVNAANKQLTIEADEHGHGGASHRYVIDGFETIGNPANISREGYEGTEILFQNGPIDEVGVNGITHEALLAIVIDRLQSFQEGAYKCRENAVAITKLEEAAMWLNKRTMDRMARGVEGTHKV